MRSEAEHLTRQLADLERQAARLLDLYQSGSGIEDDVRARLEALGKQRQAVRGRLERAQARAREARADEADHSTIARACEDALRGLEEASPEEQQQILRLLVSTVEVRQGEIAIDGWLPDVELSTAASP